MMKINKKIIKAVLSVFVMAFTISILSADAAESYTISENDSVIVLLNNELDFPTYISSQCFDSSVEWNYVYYVNSKPIEYGTVDSSFNKTLSSYDEYYAFSPKSGSGVFQGIILDTNVETSVNYDTAALYSFDVKYTKEYTITNNGRENVNLWMEGDYLVDYILYDSDDIPKSTGYMTTVPQTLGSREKLEILVNHMDGTDSGGKIVYNGVYETDVEVSESNLNSYAQGSKEDIDGLKYTVTNNNTSKVNLKMRLTQKGRFIVYNASGSVISDVSDIATTVDVPAKGKCVVYLENETGQGERFIVGYDSSVADGLDISAIRKARPSENKKVYIWFPKGPFEPAGLSKDTTGYYLSRKITYVETKLSQLEDTVGGFTIPEIKDTTGMARVNKWYVYNSKIDQPVTSFSVSGPSLNVVPLSTDFYNELMTWYGYSSVYHIYGEWKVLPITASGQYKLLKDVEYSLGSGKWSVSNDNTVYNGGMNFYLDDEAGNYTFTLN